MTIPFVTVGNQPYPESRGAVPLNDQETVRSIAKEVEHLRSLTGEQYRADLYPEARNQNAYLSIVRENGTENVYMATYGTYQDFLSALVFAGRVGDLVERK